MASPLDVLGLDPDPAEWEVERAYRQRVKETHPDLGGSRREFLRVREAYEALASGAGHDGADAPAAGGPAGSGAGEGGIRAGPAPVEYLDYAVVEDHGWALDDDDLFEKAAAADLDPADRGRVPVEPGESLLQAAERCGLAWPYACRGGACANCAVAVTEGDLEMPASHVLPREMTERGIRLSCVGVPVGEPTKVVFNVKHRPDLDDLRLPPNRFDLAQAGD